MSQTQLLPHNFEAEASVLGAAMDSQDALAQVIELLEPSDFFKPAHQAVFDAIRSVYARADATVTVNTVAHELALSENLHTIGGANALLEMMHAYTTTAAARGEALVVKDLSVRRRLIQVCNDIMRRCQKLDGPADELLEEAQRAIFEIASTDGLQDPLPLGQLILDRLSFYEELAKTPGALIGIPTGFYRLDQMTRGLMGGQMILVAARPGAGKTAFLGNIALHASLKAKKAVAVFLLEMGRYELADRATSAGALVAARRLRTGDLATEDWGKISNLAGRLGAVTLLVDDTPSLTMMRLRARCRRLKARGQLDLVIVDYLQLLQAPRASNRQEAVAELSRQLKVLARELDVPVLAAAQVNREPDSRADKRPTLADLRESGALEADADIVAFLYRPAMYGEETETPGETELIVAKHRSGPTGTVSLRFEPHYSRFATEGDVTPPTEQKELGL